MSGETVRHVVERALERHAEGFEGWFPAPFDWRSLCADAPQMALKLERREPAQDPEADAALVPELDLVEAAEQVFAHAYLGALAGIALTSDDERDPDLLVERLLDPLDDEAEERFEALATGSLGRVERALAGQGETLDEESVEAAAHTLVEAAWPGVEVSLESLAPFDPERDVDLPHGVRQVLSGLARLAAILAAFRWLSQDDAG